MDDGTESAEAQARDTKEPPRESDGNKLTDVLKKLEEYSPLRDYQFPDAEATDLIRSNKQEIVVALKTNKSSFGSSLVGYFALFTGSSAFSQKFSAEVLSIIAGEPEILDRYLQGNIFERKKAFQVGLHFFLGQPLRREDSELFIKTANNLTRRALEFENFAAGFMGELSHYFSDANYFLFYMANAGKFTYETTDHWGDTIEGDAESMAAFDTSHNFYKFLGANADLLANFLNSSDERLRAETAVTCAHAEDFREKFLSVVDLDWLENMVEKNNLSLAKVLLREFDKRGDKLPFGLLNWVLGNSIIAADTEALKVFEDYIVEGKTGDGIARDVSNKENRDYLLAFIYSSYGKEMREIAVSSIKKMMAAFGLTGDIPVKFLQAWKDGSNSKVPENFIKNFAKTIEHNLTAMSVLEQAKPGICKILYEEFGIVHFARYPEELLLDQYDQRDQEMPFGVISSPLADWNGSFYGNKETFKGLFSQTKQLGYAIRVFEDDHRLSLARRFLKAYRQYGPADFALISGHGTRNSIQLGNLPKKFFKGQDVDGKTTEKDEKPFVTHMIEMEDLSGLTKRSRRFIKPGGTIILNSCSTSMEDEDKPRVRPEEFQEAQDPEYPNIARKSQDKFGAKVIGPRVPVSIKEIKVHKNQDGSLGFSVEYQNIEGDKNITRIYEQE